MYDLDEVYKKMYRKLFLSKMLIFFSVFSLLTICIITAKLIISLSYIRSDVDLLKATTLTSDSVEKENLKTKLRPIVQDSE